MFSTFFLSSYFLSSRFLGSSNCPCLAFFSASWRRWLCQQDRAATISRRHIYTNKPIAFGSHINWWARETEKWKQIERTKKKIYTWRANVHRRPPPLAFPIRRCPELFSLDLLNDKIQGRRGRGSRNVQLGTWGLTCQKKWEGLNMAREELHKFLKHFQSKKKRI